MLQVLYVGKHAVMTPVLCWWMILVADENGVHECVAIRAGIPAAMARRLALPMAEAMVRSASNCVVP